MEDNHPGAAGGEQSKPLACSKVTVGYINYLDTNIGRTETAEMVDLVQGCSPTHVLIANQL